MNAEGKTEADARDPEKAKEMRDPMNVTAAFPMPQGQFLYDVRKKIGLLDPLHLIMYRIHATSVHYICFLGTPSPTHCGRHMCMLPRSRGTDQEQQRRRRSFKAGTGEKILDGFLL